MWSSIWHSLLSKSQTIDNINIDRSKMAIAVLRGGMIDGGVDERNDNTSLVDRNDIEETENRENEPQIVTEGQAEDEGVLGKRKPSEDVAELGLTETKVREIKEGYHKRLECNSASNDRYQES